MMKFLSVLRIGHLWLVLGQKKGFNESFFDVKDWRKEEFDCETVSAAEKCYVWIFRQRYQKCRHFELTGPTNRNELGQY
jgi:hypothetical protein